MSGENSMRDSDSDFYQSLLRAYIDSANDGIFVVCDEMKFHVANHKLAAWLGESEQDLTRHRNRIPITQFLGVAESEALFRQAFDKALSGQAARFECAIAPARGKPRWVELSLNRVDLEVGDLVIGVVRDVTARRQAQEELARQAISDPLTGLANRREFNRWLDHLVDDARAGGGPHALLYMDLDQFKVVNDTCGHMAGDHLLRNLSSAIRDKIRKSDILARLGGDEFGILLQRSTVEEAMQTAETLRTVICNTPFHWQDRPFQVGVSIGVYGIDANSSSAEAMSSADAACYVAKDKGRNRIQLYFGGNDCAGRRKEMEWVARINHALQENRFCLHYQKIQALRHAGACQEHREILLRMLDEDGDLILPGQFIPLAERYDLMPKLDRWVIHALFSKELVPLREAYSRCATEGIQYPLMWTINLSGSSLGDERFLEYVEAQFLEHAPPPGSICFEITETAAITNLPHTLKFIETFKAHGCRFALDDFGSGVSSFGYLKSLPVDILKIDGALIRGIAGNRIDYAMVQAVQHVAKEMGVQTVAEYVEDQATLDALHEIGVDYVQGYAIHKPESLSGAERALSSRDA
ncbi:MAG: EAL domain-containing protein [Betaproteobacteria bacterium]|nr:EAL domain-containing protein [Betaproteobacteria bacterium]